MGPGAAIRWRDRTDRLTRQADETQGPSQNEMINLAGDQHSKGVQTHPTIPLAGLVPRIADHWIQISTYQKSETLVSQPFGHDPWVQPAGLDEKQEISLPQDLITETSIKAPIHYCLSKVWDGE